MNPVESIIKSHIRASGAITFARFMELALYHPEFGYYASHGNIGKFGDYYTSPSVHPAFGETLANFIAKAARVLDASDFSIVEPGAGGGVLALDILDALRLGAPRLYEGGFKYVIVESSGASIERAKANLSRHREKVRFYASLADLEDESVAGCVISNEFFDALPFCRLKFQGGNFSEILVALRGEEFIEVLAEPSGLDLKNCLANLDLEPLDGQEIEICLRAGRELREVSRILSRGFALSIDYGFLPAELYHPSRMKGTFRCFHKHRLSENPYANIGFQDITAHVNFGDLIKIGESLGLDTLKYTTQGQFLVDWGMLDIAERASEKERAGMKNLFLPEAMGSRFKALLQVKNAGVAASDFYPRSPFKISFQPPGDRYGE